MSYTQYTLGSFTTELAQALNDPSHVYWAQDELNRAVQEGLLHWGALTSYWTTRGRFSTAPNVPFYDLSVQLPSLRTRLYNLGQLTTEIQYHLLESPSGVAGTGMTDQFTIGQITSALVRKRNEFVLDSRVPLTFDTFNITTPPPDGLVQLDQSIALIQRAAWYDGVTRITRPIRRTDAWNAQSFNPLWSLNPGMPYGYSQAEAMPVELQLIPPPLASGQLQLVYAKTLDIAIADGTVMAVPDELVHAIKYGALYEILSTDSQGFDPIRSKYCAARYTSSVELAQAQHSLLRISSNGVPLPMGTIAEIDSGNPYWQVTRGAPGRASVAFDIVALSRVPDSVYSVTCDVSQAAPVPTGVSDPIQLGREEVPYLFDFCRHILCMKLGGTEFIQTAPLYDNFLKGAAQRSRLIGFKAPNYTALFETPKKQESETHAA